MASILKGATLDSSCDVSAATGAGGTPGDGTITDAKLADVATGTVKGRTAGGTGAPTDLAIATTLKTALSLAKADVGLGNCDNTSDANKPVSTATQTAIDLKANIEQWAQVSSSNVTLTAQTLADITGLSLALLANSTYTFYAKLSVASSSTAGNGYGVQYSAAGAAVEAGITGTLAAATQKALRISALNTSAQAFVTVAANGSIEISGRITTGANAGNLTIQHLKVTSGTSTVYIGSFLTAVKRA